MGGNTQEKVNEMNASKAVISLRTQIDRILNSPDDRQSKIIAQKLEEISEFLKKVRDNPSIPTGSILGLFLHHEPGVRTMTSAAILSYLAEKGQATISEMAEKFSVTTSSVNKIANKLVQYGYLTREEGGSSGIGGKNPLIYRYKT